MELTIPDFENGLIRDTLVVPYVNPMQLLDGDLVHLVRHRVIAVANLAVDTSPDAEMRSKVLHHAEELVDVAFPVADVDAPLRTSKQLGRLRYYPTSGCFPSSRSVPVSV
jgi:hypothetical protein